MLILRILKNYSLFQILILGIISGMPFAILLSALVVWLKDSGIDIAIITTFALARTSYSLKVLWAPLVDYFSVPILKKYGNRKSWMILTCFLISLVLLMISFLTPKEDLSLIYFLAVLLGLLSATFDIVVDAFRVDEIVSQLQAIASATAVLGYRIGMLITGAGALYFVEIVKDWSLTFITISILFILSVIFIFSLKETKIFREQITNFSLLISLFNPFKEFFLRENAFLVLLAIIFFKLGDAMLGVVAMPFYLEIGYSKMQIALIAKFYGLFATLLGSFVGGLIVYKIGNFRGLILTGVIQSITHFAFIWLNHQVVSDANLLIAISIENFAAATGASALVGYISILCNKKYSASQYALLSSSASLFNNTITIYAGSLVKFLGWDQFFLLTIIMALPALILLFYLNRRIVL